MRFRAPLEPGEEVVTCNRAHPTRLLRPALTLLAAIFLASVLQVVAGAYPAWSPVGPILLVAALIYAVARLCRWLVTGYALTTRRIVIFRSLRARRPLALPLEHVLGVVGPRGVAHRVVGSGTVRVALPGQAFDLTHQKEPARFARLCEQQRAEFIGRGRRSGV